ncbi:NADH-quinone oxidoreductase subunit D 2 [Bienertia sinuspersici]
MLWSGRSICVTSLLVGIYVLDLLPLTPYQNVTSAKTHLLSFIARLMGVHFAYNVTWLFMLGIEMKLGGSQINHRMDMRGIKSKIM